MLTGVLVIAFPVSVFSDLWSHELKKMDDFDPYSTANYENLPGGGSPCLADETETNTRTTQPTFAVGRQPLSAPEQSISSKTSVLDSSAWAASEPHILMQKEDVRDIFLCLASIQSQERRIRSIMRKYELVDTNIDREIAH